MAALAVVVAEELLILGLWLALWTPLVALLEYGAHRWIQHAGVRLLDPSLDHQISHRAHHRGSVHSEHVDTAFKDCLPLTLPAFLLLAAWGAAVGPWQVVVKPVAGLLAWAFIYAYLWTRIHRAIHGIEMNWFQRSGCVFRFFAAHHLKHHRTSGVNYGAVFPWTDVLFGTRRKP
jgi:sterol desaturase/sphingolipid hydroxylase (fatty acid hydroxylase superfamily)